MNGLTAKKTDPIDISNIIPPKLRKNYDVFILLKPKDMDTSNNNDSEETNLIDLHTDVPCSKRDVQELSNKEIKKELSVIDLYEDITVSPDTLRLQKNSIDKEIFDPLEFKTVDNEATAKVTDTYDTHKVLKDLYKYNEQTPTTSTAKDYVDFHDKSNHIFKQTNATDDEDLIDEFLADINHRLTLYKAKQRAQYNSKISDAKKLDVPKLIRNQNQIEVPLDNINVTKDVGVAAMINKDIKRKLPNENLIIRTETNVSLPNNKSTIINVGAMSKIDIDNTKKILEVPKQPEPQASQFSDFKRDIPKDIGVIQKKNEFDKLNLRNIAINLPNQTFQHSVSQEETRQYIDNLLQSKTVFSNVLKHYNPIDFYATSHLNEYEFIVDSIQLDKKKYKKSRVIVEDKDAAKYTEGPSLNEKKLVLPQIMDRLVEKKKRMEKYAHCNRKLILDCGARRKEIPVKLNPIVLTEDCNKERLKNFKMRQNFENFVRTGQN